LGFCDFAIVVPSLRRQRLHKLQRPLDPILQLVVVLDAFWLDQHPALHRPAREIELLDVRFLQRLFQTPANMLPLSRKPIPPNIFFSP